MKPRPTRSKRTDTLVPVTTLFRSFVEEGEGALTDIRLLAQRLQRGAVGDLLHGDGDARALVALGDGETRQRQAAGGDAGSDQKIAAMDQHGFPSSQIGRAHV